jgi:coenzyme PQQ precursor peptide PqqA
MQWIKPEFEEVTLSMEVTAYVNTGDGITIDSVDGVENRQEPQQLRAPVAEAIA